MKISEEGSSISEDVWRDEVKLRREQEENFKVRDSILVEESVLHDKIEIEIDDISSDDKDSLEKSCIRLQNLLDEYFSLVSRAKIAFGSDFSKQESLFEDTKTLLRKKLKVNKSRISELIDLETQKCLEEKLAAEKRAADSKREEKVSAALALAEEIEFRAKRIIDMCDYLSLENLDDFKILDLSKNLPVVDCDLKEVIDKMSKFNFITSTLCDPNDPDVLKIRDVKSQALDCRNKYAMRLHDIMKTRDINEEKLKQSLNTPIDLGKFSICEGIIFFNSFNDYIPFINPIFYNFFNSTIAK